MPTFAQFLIRMAFGIGVISDNAVWVQMIENVGFFFVQNLAFRNRCRFNMYPSWKAIFCAGDMQAIAIDPAVIRTLTPCGVLIKVA